MVLWNLCKLNNWLEKNYLLRLLIWTINKITAYYFTSQMMCKCVIISCEASFIKSVVVGTFDQSFSGNLNFHFNMKY